MPTLVEKKNFIHFSIMFIYSFRVSINCSATFVGSGGLCHGLTQMITHIIVHALLRFTIRYCHNNDNNKIHADIIITANISIIFNRFYYYCYYHNYFMLTLANHPHSNNINIMIISVYYYYHCYYLPLLSLSV